MGTIIFDDNSPIPPTCPTIDDVIDLIKSITSNLDEYPFEAKCAFLKLEEIRIANATLRQWGNEQHRLAIYFEEKCKLFQSENSNE